MDRRPTHIARLIAALGLSLCAGLSHADQGALSARVHAHDSTGTTQAIERWRFDAGAPVRNAADHDGRTLFVPVTDGRLHALDLATGIPRWHADLGAALGAPVVVDGSVVVMDRSNRVHLIDAEDGRIRWTRETGPDMDLPWGAEGWDYNIAAPEVTDDAVYVGSGDGGLYKLRRSDGRVLWRYATGGRIRATPTLHDGVVYIGAADGLMHAVDAADGSALWTFATEGASLDSAEFGFDRRQIMSTVSISGELVVFGSRDARLYALDRSSGEERWRFEEQSAWIIASPTVAGEVIYSTRSSSANVRAIDAANGEELWVNRLGSYVFAPAVVLGDRIYAGDEDGVLHALARADGEVIWRYDAGDSIWAMPVVHGDTLYLGDDSGLVRALTDRAHPQPSLAMFWDESLRDTSFMVSDGDLAGGRATELNRAGFRVLNRNSLGDFVRARRADGRASVIVFMMDGIPDALLEGDDGVADYLADGGRVVWTGLAPGLVRRDPDTGAFQGADPAVPGALLDLDLSAWNWDVYPSIATEAGRGRGLPRAGTNWALLAAPTEATTVLAVDEFGRPTAWEHRSPRAPGGFVYLGRMDAAGCAIASIARHGIGHGGRVSDAATCVP